MRKFYFPFTRSIIYLPYRDRFSPPSSAQVAIPQDLNSCECTQSEQSLCSHTWEFVEMTPILHILMSSSPLHLITPPPSVLCPLPPSSAAPRLPMSLTQAPGARARVRARCCGFPCLGHRNGAHRKMRDGRSTGLGWPPLVGSQQQ